MGTLTPFGTTLRKFRVEKNLTLHDLAKLLGISPAFVSAVETGRKPIPDGFVRDAANKMSLTADELALLRKASDKTRKEVRVDKLPEDQRELVAMFARSLTENISAEKLERIKKAVFESYETEEPFKRPRRGFVVPPLSKKAIASLAEKVRAAVAPIGTVAIPIIPALEFVMPKLMKDFYLDVRSVDEMGEMEGLVVSGGKSIQLREDVYQAACQGEGRARFTCCHEFGHFLMHRSVMMARVREGEQVFCDSEWQADTFAGYLMMPANLAGIFANEYLAAKELGMTPLAARVMRNKHSVSEATGE